MATPWFAGVCDQLLVRFQVWLRNYEKGQVYATRQFLSTAYEKQDRPVQYVHDVPFSLVEMTHLFRILSSEIPKEKTTEDFGRILRIMKNPGAVKQNSKWIRASQTGHFTMSLVLEKSEIIRVLEVLEAVKEGRPVAADAMTAMVEQKKQSGKGMWE